MNRVPLPPPNGLAPSLPISLEPMPLPPFGPRIPIPDSSVIGSSLRCRSKNGPGN